MKTGIAFLMVAIAAPGVIASDHFSLMAAEASYDLIFEHGEASVKAQEEYHTHHKKGSECAKHFNKASIGLGGATARYWKEKADGRVYADQLTNYTSDLNVVDWQFLVDNGKCGKFWVGHVWEAGKFTTKGPVYDPANVYRQKPYQWDGVQLDRIGVSPAMALKALKTQTMVADKNGKQVPEDLFPNGFQKVEFWPALSVSWYIFSTSVANGNITKSVMATREMAGKLLIRRGRVSDEPSNQPGYYS